MLRMLIADDEDIICEAIRNLIDWKSLGVEIVAVCENGLEAYDAVLDEYPDIVLTDIKMPGLSGLELIARLRQAGGQIEFIILSGYEEFSFATEAMRHGVRHYLLKPCNEQDIIAAVKDAARVCTARKQQSALHQSQKRLLYENVLHSVLLESLSRPAELDQITIPYRDILDFRNTPYTLHYLYFLEEQNLDTCQKQIAGFPAPPPVWMLYVHLALALIVPETDVNAPAFDGFLDKLTVPGQTTAIRHDALHFPSLYALLTVLLQKLCRFETIYTLKGGCRSELHNSQAYYRRMKDSAELLLSGADSDWQQGKSTLRTLFQSLPDPAIRLSLAADLLSRHAPAGSQALLNETLLKLEAAGNSADAANAVVENLDLFFPRKGHETGADGLTARIREYLLTHLADTQLSLKWLAENYLYMNVDYVSRQFSRQTGLKFSAYLNGLRAERAKELLAAGEKAASVSEQVGCGSSLQYFSLWFKRQTGLSPTQYVKSLEK